MQCLRILDPDDWPAALAAAVTCLRQGGVLAAPTETVYGLMALWGNAAGRERILALKQRPAEKLFQALIAGPEQAARFGLLPDPRLVRLARRFWPGPLTIVCPCGDGTTVGLRAPDHAFVQALLGRLGAPLAATSANRSGLPPARTAEAAVADLAGAPDLLLDGGTTPAGVASTVVSLVEPGALRVLRVGLLGEAEIREAAADGQPP